ncbi:MAG: 50S ribosomal protein L29 [Gammaproteobacteria bacterium]|nr:50S ribosomal protein L29 [Gammaproteobacteria bacterium]
MSAAGELRGKSREDFDKLLLELVREHFNLRMQKGSGQAVKPHRLRGVKRDIARVKTILNEPKFNIQGGNIQGGNQPGAATPGGAR